MEVRRKKYSYVPPEYYISETFHYREKSRYSTSYLRFKPSISLHYVVGVVTVIRKGQLDKTEELKEFLTFHREIYCNSETISQ
jgi:hypothetical protein